MRRRVLYIKHVWGCLAGSVSILLLSPLSWPPEVVVPSWKAQGDGRTFPLSYDIFSKDSL